VSLLKLTSTFSRYAARPTEARDASSIEKVTMETAATRGSQGSEKETPSRSIDRSIDRSQRSPCDLPASVQIIGGRTPRRRGAEPNRRRPADSSQHTLITHHAHSSRTHLPRARGHVPALNRSLIDYYTRAPELGRLGIERSFDPRFRLRGSSLSPPASTSSSSSSGGSWDPFGEEI